MLSEDANEKSINLAVRISKTTAIEIRRALDKLIIDLNKKEKGSKRNPSIRYGRTTLKQLSAENDGLSSIELKNPNLRLLDKIARRHGVYFAPLKDGKGKYTLFFKGKDIDSVTHAFTQYSKKVIKQDKGKPPIKVNLDKARTKAKQLEANKSREKNRNRGEINL